MSEIHVENYRFPTGGPAQAAENPLHSIPMGPLSLPPRRNGWEGESDPGEPACPCLFVNKWVHAALASFWGECSGGFGGELGGLRGQKRSSGKVLDTLRPPVEEHLAGYAGSGRLTRQIRLFGPPVEDTPASWEEPRRAAGGGLPPVTWKVPRRAVTGVSVM